MDNRDVVADKHISRFVIIFEITQGVWTTSQQPNFKLLTMKYHIIEETYS